MKRLLFATLACVLLRADPVHADVLVPPPPPPPPSGAAGQVVAGVTLAASLVFAGARLVYPRRRAALRG